MVIGRFATFESSSVTCPSQPGSMNPAVEWMSRPEPAEARLPFESRDEVVGERDALERGPEHELAGVEDERLVVVDLDELGEILLVRLHVDVRVAGVAEHSEVAVDANVEARRLHQLRRVRIDADPALVEKAADGAIGEDHAAILRGLR